MNKSVGSLVSRRRFIFIFDLLAFSARQSPTLSSLMFLLLLLFQLLRLLAFCFLLLLFLFGLPLFLSFLLFCLLVRILFAFLLGKKLSQNLTCSKISLCSDHFPKVLIQVTSLL